MKIVIGAGKKAEEYIENHKSESLICYDNDRRKWGGKISGIEIITLDEFLDLLSKKCNEVVITAEGQSVLYFLKDVVPEGINVYKYDGNEMINKIDLVFLPEYFLDYKKIEQCKLKKYKDIAQTYKNRGNNKAYEHAMAYIKIKEENIFFPEVEGIELTNYCNLKCPNCPTPTCKRDRGFMSDEIFEECFKYISPNVDQYFSLHGLGEPLLHDNIFKYIDRLAEIDKPIVISTNGVLLSGEMAKKLFASLSRFSKSKVYISFHTKKSVENWMKCLDYIKDKSSENIICYGQILEHNREQAIKWLGEVGIDNPDTNSNIRFISSHSFAGNVETRRRVYCDIEVANRYRNCYYHLNNVTAVAWDGRLKTCCLDSEIDENVGDIFNIRESCKQQVSYNLCHTCDPDWMTRFQ